MNPVGQNGFRSFQLQNGPNFNSRMGLLLIWYSLGDRSSMKQPEKGFFILIPGKCSQEKGIWAEDYNRFYNLYQTLMNGTHKTCYSKLQFLAFLAKKCNNPAWVCKHWPNLISMYFLLIYDQTLLFAQTREDRSPINGYTCLEFATNRSNGRETCEKIMEEAVSWFLGDLSASVLYRDTGLTETALRKVLSVVEKDWLHNKKGRRRKLYYCPEKLWEKLCYRDEDEPEADWARRREESLYQIIRVLRIPAPNYYLQHRNDLAITETQWREIVVNCLRPIGRRVEQELKDQMSYRPYFLRDQLSALSKLESRAKKDADLFLRLNKIWNKSSIFDEVTLPNSITSRKKVERFSQMIKHLEESPTPSEAGLLFLIRANMHRLFGSHRSSSDLENTSGVAVGDARRFFDRIQTESEACLVGVGNVDQGPAVAAGSVALIIAVLAERGMIGSGVVLPPYPFPAFPAEYSVFFQAVETQRLPVKGVELRLGYMASALSADVRLIGHDDRLLYNKVEAPGNYPEAFTVIIYTSICGGYGTVIP